MEGTDGQDAEGICERVNTRVIPKTVVAEGEDGTPRYKPVVPKIPGYEVDYVYGSDARHIKNQGPTQTAMQIRDALGEQPGA